MWLKENLKESIQDWSTKPNITNNQMKCTRVENEFVKY